MESWLHTSRFWHGARIFLTALAMTLPSASAFAQAAVVAATSLAVERLRCEYRVDPLGIDAAAPRLSWIVASNARGAVQRAYRVIVASTPEILAENRGDLWDSGVVESSDTAQILYDGVPLKSRMQCFWKVQIWGPDSKPSAWSEPAHWTMGLLQAADWKAQWIGMAPDSRPDGRLLDKAQWIWTDASGAAGTAEPGRYLFRRDFDIPADRGAITSATLCMTADNQFTVWLNSYRTGRGSNTGWGEAQDVAVRLKPGRNIMAVEASNIGEAPSAAGLIGRLEIRFEKGDPLVILTGADWHCMHAQPATPTAPGAHNPANDWIEANYDVGAWPAAQATGVNGMAPWGEIPTAHLYLPPARQFQRTFKADKPVKRATLYATALGLYEIDINGMKAGDAFLAPGWTDYSKRVYYETYDVTRSIKQGDNAIGALLADGWYSGYIALGAQREQYGRNPLLRAQLEIEYADGTKATIGSDSDWQCADSALKQADLLMGEMYDATAKTPDWKPAIAGEAVDALVQAHPGEPIRVLKEIEPTAISQPRPGVYIFNLGQNFTGFARLKLQGKHAAGQKIVLRYGERLNPDGTLYTENLRQARATDAYIASGASEETWQPRFTFHGFQYVEATGLPQAPDKATITGIALTSDNPIAGHFESSDPIANQLYSNIQWTQWSNFLDIPTDCPQRDERLGWTGDAQIYIRTATYNDDVAAFFSKWLVDLDDSQTPAGAFPVVAPRKGALGTGVAAWSDAGVICPWTYYEVYGDKVELARHYDAMKRWVEFCRKNSTDLVRPNDGYGDWLNIDDDTPRDLLGTAYFAYSTSLLADSAKALGKEDDAKRYGELFEQIKTAFAKAFLQPDGQLKGDTQTAYVLALRFKLLPEALQKAAADRLIEKIKGRGWRLSTGFLGTKDLMGTLTAIGRTDVAYHLFENDDFPSWRFSIKQGATSIWERWDGWTPEKGFQTPEMNSFAHYSFGAVAQWMFATIGGIDTQGPGYAHLVIHPRPGGKLTWAKTEYDSIRGPIKSDWKIEGGRFKFNLTIPANATAAVYLPASDPASVLEGGKPLAQSQGIEIAGVEGADLALHAGSGEYAFDLPFAADRMATLKP